MITDTDKPVVASSSRTRPVKGHPKFVRAVEWLCSNEDWELKVIVAIAIVTFGARLIFRIPPVEQPWVPGL